MKRIKRALKIIGFVILIVLASVGIGITGAAPITLNRKDSKPDNGTNIELVEENRKQTKASKQREIE